MRSRTLIAGLLAAATLFAAACGSDDAGPPSTGGTIIDAEDQSPPILNVLLADGATVTAQRIVSNVLQNLLTADQTGAYVPQLAERVPAGDDIRRGPLRVTFHLRPGAHWSDGRPVTSADVAFTWRTMTDPDNQVASRAGWDQITAIRAGRTAAGGACPAATCFTVAFRGDYAPWRDVFSVSGGYYVLPRHVLMGKDFNTVWNRGGIVGSGPFTLESFTPAVRAVLARDPDYWGADLAGGGPFLDSLVINFLDSPGAAITALRQGEAQMTSPPPDPDLIARAAAIDGVEVQSVPSLFFEHMILNTAAAPLDDERVRQALAYAIDRQQIVDVLLDGSVPVLQSVVRPAQLGYAPGLREVRIRSRRGGRAARGGRLDPGRRRHLREGRPRSRDPRRLLVRERPAAHHGAADGGAGARRGHPPGAEADVLRPPLRERAQRGRLHRRHGRLRRRG